jgi:hypothetical protein
MRRVPEGGLVVLALAGLAVWMTWPIAAHLGTHVYDPGGLSRAIPGWVHPDIHLTTWIVGWVARRLPAAPATLFDAPIFAPAPSALAYSEHLLGATPITLPAYWLGGLTFAHQTLLLMTFVLSALAAAAAAGAWTRSAAAALVAGALYAFAPWRFHALHGVHLECAFYLPVVFLLAQRWLATGRVADLAGMTVALAGQALAAYSLAYPAFAAVVPFVVVLALVSRAPARRLVVALAGVGAAAAVLAAASVPYLRVQASDPAPVPVMVTWSPENLQWTQTAALGSYLDGNTAAYLGVVSLVLAAAGIVAGLRGRPAGAADPRALVWALLATAIALVVLGLGPYADVLGLPLAGLWEAVPGLRYYRVPLRFSFFVSLPVAVLGGLAAAALAGLVERRAGRPAAWLATAALVGAVCWQGPRGPIPLSAFAGEADVPPVYQWLARQPCEGDRCAVLEVPAGPDWDQDPIAVYRTLAHGQPVVNGYSGFAPAAYPMVVSLAAQLPEAAARVALGALTGARWLVVHRARLTAAERRAWDAAALPQAARLGDDVVYEIPVMDLDWRAAYVTPPSDATFAGTPLAALPAGSRAELRLEDDLAATRRGSLRVEAVVTNAGDAPWPALTSRARDRVAMTLTWIGARGPIPTLPVTTVFLPTDLGPGQRARLAARLRAPAVPGTYTLEARVVQEGREPLPGAARAAVRVAP